MKSWDGAVRSVLAEYLGAQPHVIGVDNGIRIAVDLSDPFGVPITFDVFLLSDAAPPSGQQPARLDVRWVVCGLPEVWPSELANWILSAHFGATPRFVIEGAQGDALVVHTLMDGEDVQEAALMQVLLASEQLALGAYLACERAGLTPRGPR
jgi:hypothetical protein